MDEPPPYVDIPSYAVLIPAEPDSVPQATGSGSASPSTGPAALEPVNGHIKSDSVSSPTGNAMFNISSLLLTQALGSLPPPPSPAEQARQHVGPVLLTSKDPLSIPIMSANFRRFAAKCGPIFWLQDRIEEVVMWRKGNVYTAVWLAAYVFFCFYPRLTLLIPHAILLHTLFTTYQIRYPDATSSPDVIAGGTLSEDLSPVVQPPEGSPDWFYNFQALQNLMGLISDLFDFVAPYLAHLTWTTPTTQPLFIFTFITFFGIMPFLYLIPLRPIFLIMGVGPLAITHPYSLSILPGIIKLLAPHFKMRAQRFMNDDRLRQEHWRAPQLAFVSVWENQRWQASTGWTSSNLQNEERKPFTLGDESTALLIKGNPTGRGGIRDLSIPLPPKVKFVGTEDWSVDFIANWHQVLPDDDGWIYTDFMWNNPRTQPPGEWKIVGMTRSRKWIRRVYRTN